MKDQVSVTLSAPTIFPDLNAKEGKPADFARSELHVARLKFKHFKNLNTLDPNQQMIAAISMLTGLTDEDIDELYAEDAGAITKVIIGFMGAFMDVAKEVTRK